MHRDEPTPQAANPPLRRGSGWSILPVRDTRDLVTVSGLFTEYVQSLGFDVSYQGFDAELAGMPGKYAPPAGELLLARLEDGAPAGCVGLRPLPGEGTCEMKRLYVPPRGRGLGIGQGLIDEIVAAARRIGYAEIRLDTMPSMASAVALYRKAGFEPIEPYCHSPFDDALFLGLRL